MQKIRLPAVAGAFYPGDAQQLQTTIENYLSQAPPPALDKVHALIVPHAGYIYSGPIAAYAYRLLENRSTAPEQIFLWGPSHRVWFTGVALGDYGSFQTPLGNVPVAQETLQRLAAADSRFQLLPNAHRQEHCLEVQLPFLQQFFPQTPLVPLLFGQVNPIEIGEALSPFVGPDDLLVISSDLSHYHSYAESQRLDRSFIADVLRGDIAAVAAGEACGQAPIIALMTIAAERGWQPHLLDYRNSGDTAGDRRQVVGYAAIAYTEA